MEKIQFEDDEYYYYVKAIPKIQMAPTKKTVKTINEHSGNTIIESPEDRESDSDRRKKEETQAASMKTKIREKGIEPLTLNETREMLLTKELEEDLKKELKKQPDKEQKETALCLSFLRKREMHSHLVTIEIGVKCCTNKRMQLNCLTFNKDRLESLDAQSVKRRGTVQHNRMLFNHIFENVPDFRFKTLNFLLGIFNIVGHLVCHKFSHNKRFEKLEVMNLLDIGI